MDKNFLLKNKLAQELYHNHLSVKDILDDRKYLLLTGDYDKKIFWMIENMMISQNYGL